MNDIVDSPTGTSQQGTKRKAENILLREQAPKRIKALEQDVVNKIAAGEIIVAPVHALKELIENAVDAGSTSLEILVKDGGLKLLQITDNGHGINKDDLPILCERFTTSKLKTFEDLSSIGTYGFRGEALASISHIAHLTITTKTVDSSCAWRAHYADGRLAPAKPGQSPDPKPTAGRGGTQITVEDLFYNVPSRQRAFKSPSEEYAKILDVVGRYAVHCTGVAFSCKKHGESALGISTPSNATTVDCIRQIHGSSVANELAEFNVSNAKYGFKASGWTTNANYHVKRTMLLLFINHRSVESSSLKKAVEQTYATFLPKGGHPFVYINLEIDPQRVDVNVHPTKREVNFLNEDEIIEEICSSIRVKLSEVDTSRTFLTQSLLPGSSKSTLSNPAFKPPSFQQKPSSSSSLSGKPGENALVRTDSSARKITSMLPPAANSGLSSSDQLPNADSYIFSPRVPTNCRLTTIKELRASVRDAMHAALTEVFASHTYVGLVDPTRRIVAMQGGVKLFLVDYGMICNEYFYQLGLTDFGNFGRIQFEPPLDVKSLVALAVKTERREHQASDSGDDGEVMDWEQVPELVTGQLIQRREMLLEYFSMEISPDGALFSIPLLLKGYSPSLAKLPRFLMRLGPCVDWNEEKACFDTFLRELAAFYTVEQLPSFDDTDNENNADDARSSAATKIATDHGRDDEQPEPEHNNNDNNNNFSKDSNRSQAAAAATGMKTTDEAGNTNEIKVRAKEVRWALEHVLFPAFRARLVATKALLHGVVEVADLKGLYRVFERC